jgi:hypothetical protein
MTTEERLDQLAGEYARLLAQHATVIRDNSTLARVIRDQTAEIQLLARAVRAVEAPSTLRETDMTRLHDLATRA